MTAPQKPPTPKEVDQFHRYADTNKSNDATHHTLGQGPGQGSPGNHNHDGTTSRLLLEGGSAIITGSRGSATATVLNDLLNALAPLGIVNGTSA